MASKHTPGPWFIEDDDGDLSIFVPSTSGLTFVLADRVGGEVFKGADGRYSDYSRVRANARLIAAAPELLEVAEGLVELSRVGVINDMEWFGRVISAARAAIAKTTGEQP